MNLIKKYPVTFWVIIIFLAFFTVNKISKYFLNITKFEKQARPNFVEKVYGEKNKEDYLIKYKIKPKGLAPLILDKDKSSEAPISITLPINSKNKGSP